MSQDEADYSLQLAPSSDTEGGSGGGPDDPNFHGASPFPKKYVPGEKPPRTPEWYEILLGTCDQVVEKFRVQADEADRTGGGVPLNVALRGLPDDFSEALTLANALDECLAMTLSPLLARHNVPASARNNVVERLRLLQKKRVGPHASQAIDALIELLQ